MDRRPGAGVAGVMALAGLLFVASAGTAQGTDLRTDVGDLATFLVADGARADRLEEQVAPLRAAVEKATIAAGADDKTATQAAADAKRLSRAAGLTAVSGDALVVTLDDAPADDPGLRARVTSLDDLLVHQQDVQAVVNAMWQGGAEAVMLMDQRVISTSAVRCVGNTLSLQGAPYSPPYTITAIGDPERLRAAVEASPGIQIYRTYVDAFGLGYDATIKNDVEIPAYTGPLNLQYARVAGDQVPTT